MPRHGWCLDRSSQNCVAAPLVELVLREGPIGEHATNAVAESAMREVGRHER